MSHLIRVKFFVMMGLQFFIWGCWLPLIYGYLRSLGFTPAQQSWILNAFPMAAMVGLFFSTSTPTGTSRRSASSASAIW
jgi:hypothetical protein